MDLYDEVIEIKNGREIDSPIDASRRDSRSSETSLPPKPSMHDLKSDFIDDDHGEVGASSLARGKSFRELNSRSISPDTSESVSRDIERKGSHTMDTKAFEDIEAPQDIKDLMQYISRYTPQRVGIDYKLRIFIPDYIPAVGDIDAFLKIIPPEPLDKSSAEATSKLTESLGLQVVDEPCGQQSDGVLLQMKLRSIFPKPFETPSAVARSPKDIDRWISEIHALHVTQPGSQNAMLFRQMPDIDVLMAEWPTNMEKILDSVGFPSPNLECPLSTYTRIVTSLLDIPIHNPNSQVEYITALHTLFSLFIAVKGDVN